MSCKGLALWIKKGTMSKGISLRGIERHVSVSQGDDGGLYQMIGWRHSSGELRVERGLEKSGIELQDHERLLYVHKYGTYEHYVLYGDGELRVRGDGGEEYGTWRVASVRSVSSIGNILIVQSSEGMKQWLWEAGEYRQIQEAVLPLVLFERIPGAFAGDSEETTINASMSYPVVEPTHYPVPIEEDAIKRDLASTYIYGKDSLKERAYDEDAFVEAMYVRYAVRSYDGNTAIVSPPILLPATSEFELRASGELDDKMSGEELRCSVRIADGYKIKLHIPIDARIKQMDSRIYPYIDVYVSQPINRDEGLEKITGMSRISTSGSYGSAGTYHMEYEIEKRPIDVSSNVVYYRVMELSTAELSERSESIYEHELQVGEKMSQLYQLDVLEQQMSAHRYMSEKGYVYNNRYHIYDAEEEYFGGWNWSNFTYVESDEGGDGLENSPAVKIIVYLQAEGEENVLRPEIEETYSGGTLNALLSYPDARAYKMILYREGSKAEIALRPHAMEDMAYYYREGSLPWEEITEDEYASLENIAVSDRNRRANIMKVSALNNPLLWPNDKTYAVGSGRIVSMAVATKAVSEGQYGQYPLYVFTDEGVWAMSIGDGDVLYSHITPINRHVVENADTVCGIDDGVVFGTRQGLYVLQGSEAVNISVKLDDHGEVEDADNASSLAGVVKRLTGVYKESATLRSMISTGRVAYHYAAGDILLYQPNGVCYAYNIAGGVWQANSYEVQYTVDSYPKLYIIVRETADSDGVYEIADEDSMVVSDRQLIVTQGMSLDSVPDAKRLLRVHVLSHIGGDKERTEMKIGIAVSNDGKSWALSWYRELLVGSLHNVTLPHVASGYRYYSLIIETKHIDRGSYLRGLIVESEVLRSER